MKICICKLTCPEPNIHKLQQLDALKKEKSIFFNRNSSIKKPQILLFCSNQVLNEKIYQIIVSLFVFDAFAFENLNGIEKMKTKVNIINKHVMII